MYLKNLILVPFIFLIISCNSKSEIDPDNYIELVYQKDRSNDKILSHIYAQIKDSDDSIGLFINNHRYRFGYFLSNKMDLGSIKSLYPDTLAMKKTFLKKINEKPFISNFSKLADPKKKEYKSFSINEIFKVASRFFVVVNSGNTFRLKICGGGNDFEDLNAITDVSLLESVTYEAINSTFDMEKSERPKFIYNARLYFADAIKNPDSLDNDVISNLAKNRLYKMMENDKSLREFINEYLTVNSNNLPFKIKTWKQKTKSSFSHRLKIG